MTLPRLAATLCSYTLHKGGWEGGEGASLRLPLYLALAQASPCPSGRARPRGIPRGYCLHPRSPVAPGAPWVLLVPLCVCAGWLPFRKQSNPRSPGRPSPGGPQWSPLAGPGDQGGPAAAPKHSRQVFNGGRSAFGTTSDCCQGSPSPSRRLASLCSRLSLERGTSWVPFTIAGLQCLAREGKRRASMVPQNRRGLRW